ncbi:BglII/BstYI family type II restriction endonuclease [Bartonella sp. CB189]|uniref:BglII/BstYI family type II restriction endonuclease n=1 Tax=Bartonella sp. CB189 TaxID=3112254 RepID=UPI002F9662F3
MKIAKFYSHLNGFEYIQYHRPHIWEELNKVVGELNAEKFRIKRSSEARKEGYMLYSPIDMNKEFRRLFNKYNWSEKRVNNWISDDITLLREIVHLNAEEQKKTIEEKGLEPIMTYNQTDFVKDRVAVEIQFGKYSFVAHDLFVKHMSFFISNDIDVGIEVVPMKSMEKHMSSGVPYYERDLFNLMRQGRGIPAVPIILVGVAP